MSVQTSTLDALAEEGVVLSPRSLVLEFSIREFIKRFPSLALLTHLPPKKLTILEIWTA